MIHDSVGKLVLLVAHLGHLHALILEVDHVWMHPCLPALIVDFRVASAEWLLLLRILLEEALRSPILTAISRLVAALGLIRVGAML